MLDAAAGRAGLRLLDCGCGTGTNLRLLLEPYGEGVGFDLTWTGSAVRPAFGVTRWRGPMAAVPFPRRFSTRHVLRRVLLPAG
jgi:hypothetical protein